MRRLILFRHAKAESRRAGGGDEDRQLDSTGQAEAQATGHWLATHGIAPQIVLVSPSMRTRQTWEAVADMLPKTRLEIVDCLYDALPEEISAVIDDVASEAETVMVIAHNPGLQEVAVGLLSDAQSPGLGLEAVSAAFPTGAVALLDMADPAGPRLEALYAPRPVKSQYAEAWAGQEDEP